jgi:serine phosphatase RsbU (regulator of sigma subunit)
LLTVVLDPRSPGPERRPAVAPPLVLDGAADEDFDRIARLLARLVAVPVARVALAGDGVAIHAEPVVVGDARAAGADLAVGDPAAVAYALWPLRLDGEVLGNLCAIDHVPRAWTTSELTLVEDLARLAERLIALRRDALQERARHGAEASRHDEIEALSRRLQLALLPRYQGDARVHSTYEPGSDRLLLGGDFAEVAVRADGALGFVIGDVSGHGPEAAALATALRASWGALSRQGVPVDGLLPALEQVVQVERAHEDLYATVLVGTLDARGRLRAASAGHPAPIVLDAPAREAEIETGLLLGVGTGEAAWPTTTVDAGGAPLLLYTDGLIEGYVAPGRPERFGLRRLLAAADARGAIALEAVGSHLITTATAAHGAPLPDDVTTVVIEP